MTNSSITGVGPEPPRDPAARGLASASAISSSSLEPGSRLDRAQWIAASMRLSADLAAMEPLDEGTEAGLNADLDPSSI